MFQFRRFPSYAYFIQRRICGLFPQGFPHSDICGSILICSSPQLFAACHVLLRLLMPRHPPYALFSLSLIRFRICSLPEIKKLSFQSLISYFCKTITSILTSFSLDDFAICFLPAYYSLSLSFLPSRYFSFQCFSLIMQLSML